MSIFKIICAIIFTLTLSQAWAVDKQVSETTANENNSQNVTSNIPPVTLPQDQDEIDAAPDDNEFAPPEKTTDPK